MNPGIDANNRVTNVMHAAGTTGHVCTHTVALLSEDGP
jgi:hypothetical protein